jgi:hypothetical protein
MKRTAVSNLFLVLSLIVLVCLLLVACSSGSSGSSGNSGTPDGKALMQERCTKCHSLTRVETAHKTAAEWTTTVDRMISYGAQLNSDERSILIDYLAATYP